MREGEMLALTAKDINLTEKYIDINKTFSRYKGEDIITTPKTRKSKRKVPIPEFLCTELKEYMDARYMLRPEDRLIPYTKSYLGHEMARGTKASGVKKIRIHDLRHSHASLLINQGYDALVIANRLGHEKVSTTLNTYSHLFPHKQEELVNCLDGLGAPVSADNAPTPPTAPEQILPLVPDSGTQTPVTEPDEYRKVIPMPIRPAI